MLKWTLKWRVYAKSDSLWLNCLGAFDEYKDAEAFRSSLNYPCVIVRS